MKISNWAPTLATAFVLNYGIGLIGHQYAIAAETSALMACSENSDCEPGYDCRSRKGGGTECRGRYNFRSDLLATDVSQQCLSDSDCTSKQSCRSKKGGGTECRTTAQQNLYTRQIRQEELLAEKARQQAMEEEQQARRQAMQEEQQRRQQVRQDQQQSQQLVQGFVNAINEFGQQMQSSARQMQQNNLITPVTVPNLQPFPSFRDNRRINCITNGEFTSCR